MIPISDVKKAVVDIGAGPVSAVKRRVVRKVDRTAAQHTLKVVAQGYGDAGASTTRRALKGFVATSGSPDRDIGDYNAVIRQRARMLYMSAPLATSAIRTNRTNIIGTGLVPKPAIDRIYLGMERDEAIAWQQAALREFSLWADDKRNCDATGINNFYGLQQLVLMSAMLSGDCPTTVHHIKPSSTRSPYGLRLHVIEADRLCSPTGGSAIPWIFSTTRLKNGNYCHDGVEVDKNGSIVAYHFRNGYPQEYMEGPAEFVRVEAYGKKTGLPNVLFVMDTERPEQYRGVSYLAHVIEPLLQMRRYTEAELVAAVIESFFTAFVTTNSDASEFPFNPATPDEEDDPNNVHIGENEYEMGPGQINTMQPGESVTFADPHRPASGFESFMHAISGQVGAALEIPADLLNKSFNSSYSASRAALLEAWKSFRMRRVWFVDDFCAPVWELFISEAVARGRLNAPGFFSDPAVRKAYLGCNWVGPSQGQLDPVKEINAETLAIAEGLTTHEDAAVRINGSSWESNVEQLAYENQRLKEATGAADPQPPEQNQEGVNDARET